MAQLPLTNPWPPRRTGGKPELPIGTRTLTESGYVNVKTESGWRAEHVIVMEQQLGRRLVKSENVHHKNGVKKDNRPENLELWYVTQPGGQRVTDLVAYLESIGYVVTSPD
jgi:hypothetical protein